MNKRLKKDYLELQSKKINIILYRKFINNIGIEHYSFGDENGNTIDYYINNNSKLIINIPPQYPLSSLNFEYETINLYPLF